ncbi:MAG TPA: NAD-dependent epimerase/dehydratase family protein [Gemmatimonadales bacterium]
MSNVPVATAAAAPAPAPTDVPWSDESALDEWLSRPGDQLPPVLSELGGDVVVLGAGGKMGPSLARMARRALDAAGGDAARRRVYAVSRYAGEQGAAIRRMLDEAGVLTVGADLADREQVAALPDAGNVVFMAGQKFGTRDDPALTWVMNSYVPALCAERYAGARAVVFSTGNVYPLTPVRGGGSREGDAPRPLGEYAMSCLGRERLWEFFAERGDTRVTVVRLSYACALRYGVLTDIARRVWEGEAVDVTMGAVNVIWQGDANRLALLALAHVDTPPLVVNVTGTRTLLVRDLAAAFGERLGRAPVIAGREAPDALLSRTERMRTLLGEPEVDVETLLDWTAGWVRRGGALLDKPTRFEVRDGGF